MNKSVLYLGGFELPDKNAAAQRVISNAKIFRDLGYDVSLVGLSSDIKSTNFNFKFEGFNCFNLPYPKGPGWLNYLIGIKQYKQFLKKRPNLVVAYNFPALALHKLHQYCRKHNIKVIGDVTEWYLPKGNFLFKMLKSFDTNLRMKKVHFKLDGLIVISKFLDKYYKDKISTVLLPPLVDIENVKWRRKTTFPHNNLQFIYAGTGSKKDRLDYIIDALANITKNKDLEISFKIMGTTIEKFCELYHRPPETIPQFVDFLGRIPHRDVLELLKDSDFQLFVREDNIANRAGFPTKFVESVSSGTLVVTNPSSDLGDYMQGNRFGFFVDISSPEKLHESLSKVISLDKKIIEDLSSKINKAEFDYRRYINKFNNFLEQINSHENK